MQDIRSEYAIIGGGVVGLSVAFGLLNLGKSTVIFDDADQAFRASRGNFGLIWVQGKGIEAPAYARWTRRSANAWREFSNQLEAICDVDLALSQTGGYDFYFSEKLLYARADQYERLNSQLDGSYAYEILDHCALKKHEPGIGPSVTGAILHPEDGHVNPLKLLRSLATAVRHAGGVVHTNSKVISVNYRGGEFQLKTTGGETYSAKKIVLSAGLGALELGPALGFKMRIYPQRGQLLISEKLPKIMNRPSGWIRQVDEGGVQIGDSKENAGFDDRETLETISQIAARAIKIYPVLEKTNLIRSWGALRIMSPDGLPIYQQSKTAPGAYLITCHSGITLAAAHARFLPHWIEGRNNAPDLEAFSEDRF